MSVEVACYDDVFVIWYVVVWESLGEICCCRIYGCVVVAVIVYIQYGDRTRVGGNLHSCNVSTLELNLFVAVC